MEVRTARAQWTVESRYNNFNLLNSKVRNQKILLKILFNKFISKLNINLVPTRHAQIYHFILKI